MNAKRNTEARSCNHCCSGKAIRITHSECVYVALSIQYEMRMRHIVIRGLFGSTIFFHIISQTARFSKKVTEHKMCFDFSYNFCLKHFSI
jgi:hypothetical protein